MPDPIWTPYDPDTVIGDFSWLWLDDGPMGSEWVMIFTVEDDPDCADGVLVDMIGQWDDKGERECVPAARFAGRPYLPCLAPACEPDVSDALSVTVQWAPGASATHTFGDPVGAKRALDAVTAAMALGRISS